MIADQIAGAEMLLDDPMWKVLGGVGAAFPKDDPLRDCFVDAGRRLLALHMARLGRPDLTLWIRGRMRRLNRTLADCCDELAELANLSGGQDS